MKDDSHGGRNVASSISVDLKIPKVLRIPMPNGMTMGSPEILAKLTNSWTWNNQELIPNQFGNTKRVICLEAVNHLFWCPVPGMVDHRLGLSFGIRVPKDFKDYRSVVFPLPTNEGRSKTIWYSLEILRT
ncbi:hypothetical protein M0802_008068 [Mischocyttarus mexicanus]|nr:hypothetical protein M0802_008068 [Mischocyttarus mexicanus]